MKQAADILQLLLTDLGPFSLIASVLLTWVVFQAFRLALVAAMALWRILAASKQAIYNPFKKAHAIQVATVAMVVYLNGQPVADGIQYIEQAAICPTYIQTDTSYFLESRFEDMIKRHTNEAQFLTVRDSTRVLAMQIGCTPSDIYLVAYSECGLNPFRIRDDGKAAGWIQFTNVGAKGTGATLDQIKQACNSRDAKELMRLTGAYIRNAANGRKIHNATDFYLAVFAPSKIGAGMDGVLYSGVNNPEYYLNAGLDGYFVESGKVLYLPLRKDGKLTKRDLHAALEYKKAKLMK